MRMKSAAMVITTLPFSWKRLEKNSGSVMALPAFSLYRRRRLLVISQLT